MHSRFHALSLCISTFCLLVLLSFYWTYVSQYLLQSLSPMPPSTLSLHQPPGKHGVLDLFQPPKHFICPSLRTWGQASPWGSLFLPFLSFRTRFWAPWGQEPILTGHFFFLMPNSGFCVLELSNKFTESVFRRIWSFALFIASTLHYPTDLFKPQILLLL